MYITIYRTDAKLYHAFEVGGGGYRIGSPVKSWKLLPVSYQRQRFKKHGAEYSLYRYVIMLILCSK